LSIDSNLKRLVEQELRERDIPGGTVALFVDGGSILNAGVGTADLERMQPISRNARFYIYSITKSFLAAAVLCLVELGEVSLAEPIQRYLPSVSLPYEISVRQLLHHTSGLPDYGGLPEYTADLKTDPGKPWSDEEFLSRTLAQGFLFEPGQGWAYSNIGYMLIRQLLAQVTNRPLGDTLADVVFRPIGLARTFVAESLADSSKLTPAFSADLDSDGELHDVSRRYHPGWVSHGVIISTALETALAFDAMFNGSVLAVDSLESMLDEVTVPGTHPPFEQAAYGLGLMIDRASGYGVVAGHGGGGPGYSSAAFHFSDVAGHSVTAVALLNLARGGAATEVVFALAHALASELN
jgi:D-alanyl-D-alanine carboxypeptidase